ncbi:MAG: glycosyltransferase family 2 protein [Bacteroidetes bacterium]|nr:glycosyltransferase family 2 protein [Bacteroidota bacterium]
MVTDPLISIIIPVYNRQELVKEALGSCLWQTYQNWECIVVDDGSTDNTWQSLEEYAAKDKRIKIFKRLREPKGASYCRNIGVEKSKGDFLMFLDSDDILSQDCLNYRVNKTFEYKNYDALIFPTAIFSDSIKNPKYQWNKLIKEEDDLIRFFNMDMPWHTSGPLWNMKNLNRNDWFNEKAQSFQDWEMHVNKLVQGIKYAKIDEGQISKNTFYRCSPSHISIGTDYYSETKLKNRTPVLIETILNVRNSVQIHKNLNVAINRFIVRTCILLIKTNLKEEAKSIYSLSNLKYKKLFWLYLKTKKQNTLFNRSIEFCLYRIFKLGYLFDPPKTTLVKTKI